MTDEQNREDQTTENAPVVTAKKPVGKIILFLVVLGMMIWSVTGLVKALTGRAVDPETIQQPAHTEAEIGKMTPIITQPLPQQTIAPIEDQGEEQPPVQPEIKQQETPLKLGDKSAHPLVHEAEPVAPQSMVLWDEPKEKVILPPGHRPQIVIVIDDMGLNRRNSREMAGLKYPTTLAYMPYAGDLAQQTQDAYEHGHELIVHMPMEPQDIAHNNPGPNALLTTVSAAENRARLASNLQKFGPYIIGLNNHMGSKMTASETAMRPVMQMVKEKGLWFLDSRTIGNSVAGKLAEELKIPYVARDVFLDNTETVPAVRAQLKVLEQMARKRGYAVAIGHPYDCTLAALKEWMPSAAGRGLDIVPLSAVIARRFPAAVVPKYARVKKSVDAHYSGRDMRAGRVL